MPSKWSNYKWTWRPHWGKIPLNMAEDLICDTTTHSSFTISKFSSSTLLILCCNHTSLGQSCLFLPWTQSTSSREGPPRYNHLGVNEKWQLAGGLWYHIIKKNDSEQEKEQERDKVRGRMAKQCCVLHSLFTDGAISSFDSWSTFNRCFCYQELHQTDVSMFKGCWEILCFISKICPSKNLILISHCYSSRKSTNV